MHRRIAALGLFFAVALALPAAAAEDPPVVEEVLGILRERGLIDEAKHAELVTRNRAWEEDHASLLGRIELSGDLRLRYEGFWFDRDVTDTNRDNRHRGRYRFRLNGKAEINPEIDALFRLSTGADPRSGNQTLGSGVDFDPDGLFVHRAYLDIHPFEAELRERGVDRLSVQLGKTPNPFLWKHGRDILMWDHDLDPEGASLLLDATPREGLTVFGRAGFFVIDENSQSQDPHLVGVQLGGELALPHRVDAGVRLSWYSFRSLDPAFFTRNFAQGNLPNITGETAAADDGIQAGEVSAFVGYRGLADWPLLVYGSYLRNFDGRDLVSPPGIGDEDRAYILGIEVGDKTRYLQLGFGYYFIEANAWPGVFIDSDITDGVTNRRALFAYGARRILPRTDLRFQLYRSDDIDSRFVPFASAIGAERIRLQTDLIVSF